MANHSVICASQKAVPPLGIVAELQAKLQKNRKDLVPSKPAAKAISADVATPNGGTVTAKSTSSSASAASVREEGSLPAAAGRRFTPPASPSSAPKPPEGYGGGRPSPSNLKMELRKTTSNVTLGGAGIQGNEERTTPLMQLTRRSVGGGKELPTRFGHEDEQSGLTVVLEQPSPSAVGPPLQFGYQNVFDDPPQKPSKEAALQKQQKKPIPIPRKNSSPDVQVGGGQIDVVEGPEAEASSHGGGAATPGVSGAVSMLSRSLNNLDECSDVAEYRATRHNAVCLCKSAEDLCSSGSPGLTPPTKPRPKVLTKSTSNGPAQSEKAAPLETRNRACSEGDVTAPSPSHDDDYVPMEPTQLVTSSPRHSNGYYLQLLPTEGDTVGSPDGVYMEMSGEVFGKVGTTSPTADGLSSFSSAIASEGMVCLGTRELLHTTEGRSMRSLSSPALPAQSPSGEHQAGSDMTSSLREGGRGGGGGTHPPVVPKRPLVSLLDRTGSTSSDDYVYAIVPNKKWFSSSPGSDSPKETTPTKREVGLMKPPNPPPKSKSLLREQGVLLMENEVKKKPGDKSKQSTSAAEPVVKETTKKEGPKVEPYSSRVSKATSPMKVTGTKASMSVLAEVPEQNTSALSTAHHHHHHPPIRQTVSQSSSESDFEAANAWGLKKPLPLRPPPPKASRTRVYDQNACYGSPVDNGREPHTDSRESSPSGKGSHQKLQKPKKDTRKEGKGEGKRMSNLRTQIDRSSLMVIMENKEAIYMKLGLGSCEPSNGSAESTPVDVLGKILTEIDSLLSSQPYSAMELIKAIETHLNIRLSSPPPAEGRGKEGEGLGRGRGPRVVLTDQDVERVNQLVRTSCFEDDSEPETEGQGSGVNGTEGAEECGDDGRGSRESSNSDCEYVSSVTEPLSPNATARKPHSLSLSTIDVNQVRPGGGTDRRPSTLADDVINSICSGGSGFGTFTEKGGVLTRPGSGVRVEIPQGAILKDKRQQVWFEMKDTFVLEDPAEATCPLRQGGVCITPRDEVENHLKSKVDTLVQLSPIVEVGPNEAMLFKALLVTIPHCLSLKSLGWNIHVEGRVNPAGEWLKLPKSHSNMLACKSRAGVFWNSSYQLHLNHVTVCSSQLGAFRLVGSPMMKGMRSGKKMLACVYTQGSQEMEEGSSCLQVSVFIINDLQDHSEALDTVLPARGYGDGKQKLSFYCIGDGRDLEVTLENNSPHGRRVSSTQCVPFGQFWRQKKIGQSHVTFYLDTAGKEAGPFTVTMTVHQVGAEGRDLRQCTFLIE
eukprot:Em0002g1839a